MSQAYKVQNDRKIADRVLADLAGMQSKRVLIVACGLPGSGKTEFYRQHLKEIAHRVSYDDMRRRYFEENAPSDEDASYQNIFRFNGRRGEGDMEEEAYQVLRTAPFNVYYLDNQNRRKSDRQPFMGEELGWHKVIGIYFDTPLELCIERTQHKGIPVKFMRRIGNNPSASLASLKKTVDQCHRIITKPDRKKGVSEADAMRQGALFA